MNFGCVAVFAASAWVSLAQTSLPITQRAEPSKPFSVAGEQSAIFGSQDGSFEAWQFPVKILSHVHIQADLADYPVPIDVNSYAAQVEVTPAMTTITYSHAAFTVKQHMFAPRSAGSSAVVIFEIASVRPLQLTIEFRPEMLRMWPAPNFGTPSAEWVPPKPDQPDGFYILHTDNPDFSGLVAIPGGHPGILAPYQERPKSYPAQFKLDFDPKKDPGHWFPLLIALADPKTTPASQVAKLKTNVPQLWAETFNYYAHFFDDKLFAETPDSNFNRALAWAELSIDQGRVRFHDEVGLIAGYYQSADSARPGFGWFFGRDSLFTTYAANSYGDFDLTRRVLEFLSNRQRADGKIMHEFSQTADLLDWKSTPYFYASADSTLLYIMAMEDYLNVSGDLAFVGKHWPQIQAAYSFTRSHDSDGDGIYENTEGTGWVESWPGGMPHQEIYLASLDQQSAEAMGRLARVQHDDVLAAAASAKATEIRDKLTTEYYQSTNKFYAFSRNADSTLDATASIYPAVAWWSGRLSLPDAGPMLSRWASPEFSTDWGTRDISDRTSFYDPISYHQGSVWPLFTGWVSIAEYRAGRPLSGYAHLMQNAGLTYTQDLGAVTELLSGQFFQPLGRSSSHQIWSSAMVLTPAIRGLFGLDFNALDKVLRVNPRLPATWDHATLHNVTLGGARFDLAYTRVGGQMVVKATGPGAAQVCLGRLPCVQNLAMPLPGAEVEMPRGLPEPGAQTTQLKVTSEQIFPTRLELEFQAPGDSYFEIPVRLNRPGVKASGAILQNGKLLVRFPQGEGYQTIKVSLEW